MAKVFEDSIRSVFAGVCCAAVMCGSVSGMNEEASVAELSASQNSQPPNYTSDWYRRSCEPGGTLTKVGYAALQKDYPHKMADFEATKSAMENILADIKSGTFKNPGMQAVLDYMHWWYDIDPEQVYKGKRTHRDPIDGFWHVTIFEYQIQDQAAQILDELQQTGGTAYSTLHWCSKK
jgi:hypothetical protein